jgi:hypothetical protein
VAVNVVHTPSPAFRRITSATQSGAVLKPLLHAYLFDAKWPELNLNLPAQKASRKPDGWFHPSTHPLWPERMLYYYLTEPEKLIPEPLEYMGTMSVTIGTLMHLFIQECLRDQGVLLNPEQLAADGIATDDKGEPYLVDDECGSRGHTDGITQVDVPAFPQWGRQSFEFKTSNNMKLSKIEDLDLDTFKEKWPDYWAQQQEYLRMSGYGLSIVLMLGMGYPWDIREFHIPADPMWQHQIREKYLRVRAAVRHGQPPQPCCGPGSKEAKACVARAACPIGTMQIRRR